MKGYQEAFIGFANAANRSLNFEAPAHRVYELAHMHHNQRECEEVASF